MSSLLPRCTPAAVVLLAAAASAAVAVQVPPPSDAQAFEARVRPVLQARCVKCHNGARKEGGTDFSAAVDGPAALRRRQVWRRALARVEAGEMPPLPEKPLSRAEREVLTGWMRGVTAVDLAAAARDPGPAVLRRLTRREYDCTLRDLLGLDIDAGEAAGLPETETAAGYDTLAAAMTLSPAVLEKYLAAADSALDRLFQEPRLQPARDALLVARPGNGLVARDAARRVLARFVRRAYRRPPRDPEIDRLLPLFERASAAGASYEQAVRAAMKPVLVSPHFLFRPEEDRPAREPYRVSDHDLATRLSYFLWSTMPDDELSRLADEGRLAEPGVLEQQVRRMLAHPKARALAEVFGAQWLQLGKLETARPTTEFFPTFTRRLKDAMREETLTFLDRLRTEDRSILELLDADYTYVNAELARHYGLAPVSGKELQRVSLRPEDHRGGLLGMGSILALTSHTYRTSPTLRGKYVLEVLFGTPPPPPPANVNQIAEEKGREPKSFRELLAKHASSPACAGCHRKMDPLGFALDSYDAIGAWRESTAERPLDTSGELPSGEKLRGAADLKQVVLKRKGEFVRNLAGQMLSYALGRELAETDEPALKAAEAALQRDGYRYSSLVLAVVQSVPFQYRRPGAPAPAAK